MKLTTSVINALAEAVFDDLPQLVEQAKDATMFDVEPPSSKGSKKIPYEKWPTNALTKLQFFILTKGAGEASCPSPVCETFLRENVMALLQHHKDGTGNYEPEDFQNLAFELRYIADLFEEAGAFCRRCLSSNVVIKHVRRSQVKDFKVGQSVDFVTREDPDVVAMLVCDDCHHMRRL